MPHHRQRKPFVVTGPGWVASRVVQSSRVRPVDPATADDSLLVQIHELLRASHGLAAPEDPFAHLDATLG
jgi:hypothetical protein